MSGAARGGSGANPFSKRSGSLLRSSGTPRPGRPGEGQTLADLLGEGTHEGERDGYEWVLGLVTILVFLGLVALVFSSLGP